MREKSYFLANLFLKASNFSNLKPFSHTFGATGLATILEFFSIDELASTSVEELVAFIMKHGKARFKEPERIHLFGILALIRRIRKQDKEK